MRTLMIVSLIALAVFPARSNADRAGEALLQRCVQAEGDALSIEARFTHQFTQQGQVRTQSGTIRLQKPNLAHIVIMSARRETTGNVVINSDGKQFITYSQSDNDYADEPADIAGGNVARNNILETGIFFNPDLLNRIRAVGTGVKVAGAVTVAGTPCKVLQFTGIPDVALKLYVGPDGLLRGAYKVFKGERDETHLADLKRNATLSSAVFRWQRPHGAKTVEEVVASMSAQAPGQQAVSLLPVGRTAPDFSLPGSTGGNLTLAGALQGHRAVILNFWSYF